MSNVRRRAPAILKRRSAPRTPVEAGVSFVSASRGTAFTARTAASCTDSCAASATISAATAPQLFEALPTNYCVVTAAAGTAAGTAAGLAPGPAAGTATDDESSIDVWELEVKSASSESPMRRSVSTQADFPSRAFTALNHQLAETCQRVCPTLGVRAVRDNVIEKLTEIVNDAEGSTKARFLLEQIFAYKTKMPYHSNFMTRHCKLLMDLSQKTYQHLKDVDGTGLLTLPTKGTLRSRYPETLPVTAKNEVEVLLQMEASAEGPDGASDEQPATYYYVVPSEDILPSDIMDQ